jgi:hypothetical protein
MTIQFPDKNRPDSAPVSIVVSQQEVCFDATVYISSTNWAAHGSVNCHPGTTGHGEYWLYRGETNHDIDLVQYVEPT